MAPGITRGDSVAKDSFSLCLNGELVPRGDRIMWLGRRRRGQSAIDFIARVLRADSASEIRTHSIASLGFPVVCEIVCQIINGIFARPCRSGSSGDGRKSFREERGGKQRAGKHHPAHRVFHAAFPENRSVSVYKISHGSLCHLGLLSWGGFNPQRAHLRGPSAFGRKFLCRKN